MPITMPHRPKYTILLLSALSLLSLSACNNPLIMGQASLQAYKQVFKNDVNVKQTSFSAADFMVSQMKSFVGREDVIMAQPLTAPPVEHGYKDSVSILSYVIPHQVGTRFSQLGYKVDLSAVADNPQTGIAQSMLDDARYVLKGEFAPERRLIHHEVPVSLSVIDRSTNQIVASFDYKIPARIKKNARSPKHEHHNKNEFVKQEDDFKANDEQPDFWGWLPF